MLPLLLSLLFQLQLLKLMIIIIILLLLLILLYYCYYYYYYIIIIITNIRFLSLVLPIVIKLGLKFKINNIFALLLHVIDLFVSMPSTLYYLFHYSLEYFYDLILIKINYFIIFKIR